MSRKQRRRWARPWPGDTTVPTDALADDSLIVRRAREKKEGRRWHFPADDHGQRWVRAVVRFSGLLIAEFLALVAWRASSNRDSVPIPAPRCIPSRHDGVVGGRGKMRTSRLLVPIVLATMLAPVAPVRAAAGFAAPAFAAQWRTGEALVPNFWGPLATAHDGQQEPYAGAPRDARLVQYFDKGRMELSDGMVTNGLLATELLTGRVQVGDAAFVDRPSPAIPIAGDPDNPGPTYAALRAAGALRDPSPRRDRAAVSLAMTPDGAISAQGGGWPVSTAATFVVYDAATQHNVPASFADYRKDVGLAAIGWAITEPFVTTVKVAGQSKRVMVQAFERRVLTYTPDNPEQFRVEFGNIGQHYDRWRYAAAGGSPAGVAQPPGGGPPGTDACTRPGLSDRPLPACLPV